MKAAVTKTYTLVCEPIERVDGARCDGKIQWRIAQRERRACGDHQCQRVSRYRVGKRGLCRVHAALLVLDGLLKQG